MVSFFITLLLTSERIGSLVVPDVVDNVASIPYILFLPQLQINHSAFPSLTIEMMSITYIDLA